MKYGRNVYENGIEEEDKCRHACFYLRDRSVRCSHNSPLNIAVEENECVCVCVCVCVCASLRERQKERERQRERQ